ncbi:hypothetical protein BpHYR1_002539, partial [Brachionus plicatilis]
PETQSYTFYPNPKDSFLPNQTQTPFQFGPQINGFYNYNNPMAQTNHHVANGFCYNPNVVQNGSYLSGNIEHQVQNVNNVNNLNQMKTWKDLLKDNYSLDDLMRNLSEVTQRKLTSV